MFNDSQPPLLRLETQSHSSRELLGRNVVGRARPLYPPESQPWYGVGRRIEAVTEEERSGQGNDRRAPELTKRNAHRERRRPVVRVRVYKRDQAGHGCRLPVNSDERHVRRIAPVMDLEELQQVLQRLGNAEGHKAEVFGIGDCVLEKEFGVQTGDEGDEFHRFGFESLRKVRKAEVEIVGCRSIELIGVDGSSTCRLVQVAPWIRCLSGSCMTTSYEGFRLHERTAWTYVSYL